ncbi:hypothetical protein AWN76_010100 [Rhodothermaceae bacterium RA]|nr:hypothetical protein AWN76_010100 [Rhodothermaceae bacterium RA]
MYAGGAGLCPGAAVRASPVKTCGEMAGMILHTVREGLFPCRPVRSLWIGLPIFRLCPMAFRSSHCLTARSRRAALGWLLCAVLIGPAAAQQRVAGYVFDAETGAPLAGANVFLAQTLKGAATDTSGYFAIDGVWLGSYELVVSFLGYERAVHPLRLDGPPPPLLTLRLSPRVVEGAGVEVVADADPAWTEHLATFRTLFLGTSPDADRCVLRNPEVLHFDVVGDRFEARATEPLLIDNHALGYRLEVHLDAFQARTQGRNRTIRYRGRVGFTEMRPESRRQARRWAARRERAYNGSLRHFLTALAADRLYQEGFFLLREGADYTASYQGVPGSRATPRVSAVDPAEVVGPGALPFERTLAFQGDLKVIYGKEPPDDAYVAFREYAGWKIRTDEDQQVSWIALNQPTVTFTVDGHVEDAYALTKIGYWYVERVAEMLPREYEPPRRLMPAPSLLADDRPAARPSPAVPPRDLPAEAGRGLAAFQAAEYAQAVRALAAVVEVEPAFWIEGHGPAAYWLGQAYAAQELTPQAHRAWQHGLAALRRTGRFHPPMADALVRSVFAARDGEAYEAAVDAYLALLESLDAAGDEAAGDPAAAPTFVHLLQMEPLLTPAERARVFADRRRGTLHPGAGAWLARWWRAQDPLPGTPLNERVAEHLHRVDYARTHYRYDRAPDGFDDRGRIFVRFGAPRNKTIIRPDLNPTMAVFRENAMPLPGPLLVPPNEFWSYRHVDEAAQYLFVLKEGRYRLGTPEDLVPTELRVTPGRFGRMPRSGNTAALRQDGAHALALYEAWRSVYTYLATAHPAFEEHLTELDLLASDARAVSHGRADPGDDGLAASVAAVQIDALSTRLDQMDRAAAKRRDEQVPAQYSRLLEGVEPLPVAMRLARFLDEDGTTRTEIVWSHLPGTLHPTRRQRRSILDEREALPDRYLVRLAVGRHTADYRAVQPVHRHYLARDLPVGAPVPIQTLTLPPAEGPYHVTMQWDQYLAEVDTLTGTTAPGLHLRTGVQRVEGLTPLVADAGLLEMSDLKPVYLNPDAGWPATDEAFDGLMAYPFSTITPETEVGLYFEVYHLARGADGAVRYTVEYEITRNRGERDEERISASTDYSGAGPGAREFIALDLSTFGDAGRLDVVVRVTDRVTGQRVERTLPFTLVR